MAERWLVGRPILFGAEIDYGGLRERIEPGAAVEWDPACVLCVDHRSGFSPEHSPAQLLGRVGLNVWTRADEDGVSMVAQLPETALAAETWELVQAGILRGMSFAWDPACLLYTSPSPRDRTRSRMPSSA